LRHITRREVEHCVLNSHVLLLKLARSSYQLRGERRGTRFTYALNGESPHPVILLNLLGNCCGFVGTGFIVDGHIASFVSELEADEFTCQSHTVSNTHGRICGGRLVSRAVQIEKRQLRHGELARYMG
jgi:hypothetical protein